MPSIALSDTHALAGSAAGFQMAAFPSIRRVLQGRVKPGKVSPLAKKKAMPFR